MSDSLVRMKRGYTIGTLLLAAVLHSAAPSSAQHQGGSNAVDESKYSKEIDALVARFALQREYDEPPKGKRMRPPKYPPQALENCLEGSVLLLFVIDANGKVPYAEVLESVPALDGAAIEAAKEWRFKPAQAAGRPVATFGVAPATFHIYNRARYRGCQN